jgi:hypothetical protein
MNSSIASPVSTPGAKDDPVSDYENLRRQAMQEPGFHPGVGMALFLGQGMTAWMKARSQATAAMADTFRQRSSPEGRIPLGLRGEAALILAGMALGGLRRGRR